MDLGTIGPVLLLASPILIIVLLIFTLQRRDRRTRGLDSHTGRFTPPKPIQRLTKRETVAYLLPYVTVYALYALLFMLGVVVLFTWPTTIRAVLAAFTDLSDEWQRFLYQGSIALLGLLLGALLLAAEPYLRGGIGRGHVARRFVYLSMVLGLMGGLGVVLRELAFAAIRREAER